MKTISELYEQNGKVFPFKVINLVWSHTKKWEITSKTDKEWWGYCLEHPIKTHSNGMTFPSRFSIQGEKPEWDLL